MAIWTEMRLRIESSVMKKVLERAASLVEPVAIDNPSFGRGKELEREGRWMEGLSHFHSLATDKSRESEIRAWCWTEAAQMLINHHCFSQARRYLGEANLFCAEHKNCEVAKAQYWEKLGWIADYEGDFRLAIRHFTTAKELAEKVPEALNEARERIVGTCEHFLGRAHFGLAFQGVNRLENLSLARKQFEKDRDTSRRKQISANEAFNEAWLCRVAIVEGNITLAKRHLQQAKDLFDGDAALAHCYVLEGAIEMIKGNSKLARDNYEKSLGIRFSAPEVYQKGVADATMGIAHTYLAEGNLRLAVAYGWLALNINPLILIRPPM